MERAVLNVTSRIGLHRRLYERNEEAVKQHLIGEVMTALGWDWNNPEEVRPEERTEDGRADYALLLNGEIVAFLEAKNLSVNVIKRDEPLRQLARYCFSRGVRYGILTNGAKWVVVKAFAEGTSLRDRILFTVDLEEEPLERVLVKLSLISKDRIERLERLATLLNAFEMAYESLLGEGLGEEALLNYLRARGRSSVVPADRLTGVEVPKAVYVNENGWRPLPLGDKSLKGALLAVLDYLEGRSSGRKREEIKKAKKLLSRIELPAEKIVLLLREIEKDEGVEIGLEV